MWPAGTEAIAAAGARRIGNNLDWWEAEWPNAAYLEMLTDAQTGFGPMATLLLALGLAAKELGESGLSVDATVSALADGHLGAGSLGEAMAAPAPTGLVKAARWAKTLAVVAAASPANTVQVASIIPRSLRGNPGDGQRDEGTRRAAAGTRARVWGEATRS
ncbi:MAG: hypothetical protein U0166_01285 [Acidobacteriota bacterium]